MQTLWLEEYILFGFVMISVPALNYALERVYKRKVLNRKIIFIIYVAVFYVFFEINERLHRNDGVWELPPIETSTANRIESQ